MSQVQILLEEVYEAELDTERPCALPGLSEAALRQVLDEMRDAALVVEGRGRLLYSNASGEALLATGKALRVRRGHLSPAQSRDEQKLTDAIMRACSSPPGNSSVLIHRDEWPPLILSVSALRGPSSPPQALLIANELSPRRDAVQSRLENLFGLSKSEADVALRLAEGIRPAEIGEERKVAIGTVRNQMKSLFSKLGCTRQAEVIMLVRSIAIPREAWRPAEVTYHG